MEVKITQRLIALRVVSRFVAGRLHSVSIYSRLDKQHLIIGAGIDTRASVLPSQSSLLRT
jgi:hypothetical protein